MAAQIFFKLDDGPWNKGAGDPVGVTGGYSLVAAAGALFYPVCLADNATFTFNFGQAAFKKVVPSGYNSGWFACDGSVSAFDLTTSTVASLTNSNRTVVGGGGFGGVFGLDGHNTGAHYFEAYLDHASIFATNNGVGIARAAAGYAFLLSNGKFGPSDVNGGALSLIGFNPFPVHHGVFGTDETGTVQNGIATIGVAVFFSPNVAPPPPPPPTPPPPPVPPFTVLTWDGRRIGR